MTRVWHVILFGAVTAVACNDPEILPPTQLNLDRPVDMSFACYGPMKTAGDETADPADDVVVLSAQPARWCNEQSPVLSPVAPATLPPPPPGQTGMTTTPAWYGFILQSASGTVVLSRWASKPGDKFVGGLSTNFGAEVEVRDADPQTPGKNAISIGENPIAIATDTSGCHEVTANAGSCDLSALDINSAVKFSTDGSVPATVNRLSVLRPLADPAQPGEPVRARPAAMVVQPGAPDATVGAVCEAKPSGMAYIAYPGCNLVAGVDLATGHITQGVKFTGTVPQLLTPTEITGLTCMDECKGEAPDPAMMASLRPVTLDLRVDAPGLPTRLVIGADNSSVITVIDLGPAFEPLAAPAPLQVQLDNTGDPRLAVTTVALSPQIAMGNSPAFPRSNSKIADGPPPGGVGQYVYAVATDGTVRVADVLNVGKECDTQVDMRFVRELATDVANVPRLQCFPVGDPTTPRRRAGARGPGIEMPVDGVPTSVKILRGLDSPRTTQVPVLDADGKQVVIDGVPQTMPQAIAPAAGMLIGYFAFVTMSSGQVFIVNVDDDDGPDVFNPAEPQATAPVLLMAHQLRDGFIQRGAVPAANANRCTASDPGAVNSGGPRTTTSAVPTVAADTLSNDAQSRKGLVLPDVLKEACAFADAAAMPPIDFNGTVSQLQIGASPALRDEVYPDLRATRNETWTLTWEGALSKDSLLTYVDGPPIRNAQMLIDRRGIHLVDDSRPFCEIGVESFDIVQLRGCDPINGNSDCPSGYSCFVHEDNPVNGLGACMLESEASRLSVACRDFLTSARRYTVAKAESGELTLHPRKHVLATTPVDGCVSDTQCSELASHALALRSSKHPFELTGDNKPKDSHAWQCVVDPLRAPVGGDPTLKRCVEVCAATTQCEAGSVCVGATGTLVDGVAVKDGTCMESVLPPQSCVNGPQRFSVHASEAFTMIGLRSGYVHAVIEKGGVGDDRHACVIPDDPGTVQISRIPLQAKACDPAANKSTGALPGGGFEANPCATTVTQVTDQPNYVSLDPVDACVVRVSTPEEEVPPTVPLTRTGVPAIKVRTSTMTLTLADPYAPGDLTCAGDRLGTLGRIPQLLPAPFDTPNWFGANYQLSFDQRGGFSPFTLSQLQIAPAFPVKVVLGPSESIWIIDDGDTSSVNQASTRGQVYRVEMSSLTTVNLLH